MLSCFGKLLPCIVRLKKRRVRKFGFLGDLVKNLESPEASLIHVRVQRKVFFQKASTWKADKPDLGLKTLIFSSHRKSKDGIICFCWISLVRPLIAPLVIPFLNRSDNFKLERLVLWTAVIASPVESKLSRK